MSPFQHIHPYAPFLFESAQKWIVGTLPPPRFTQGMLRPGDVDFCYGSRDGQLWPILNEIFDLDLVFETTDAAIEQRKSFLLQRGIGICDIVDRAERDRIDASDLGMKNIELRDLLSLLKRFPNVTHLLFTGGNSKNGPEYLFRRHLKEKGLRLERISDSVPRIHQFRMPERGAAERLITTVSLTAPSGSANRAVGSLPEYKARKAADPKYTTLDFRVAQYRKFF
ncbi:uracil-DNA glycosylase family protein [Robiginitalea sp.]|uniref:uracil-DNA glycosylase family protein n=1 Tax=Robiginitalea sp. TaxID=1902411 RepID=UPI003C77ED10